MGHQRNEESVGAEDEEYKQIECAISGDGLEEVVDIVQVRDGQPARFGPFRLTSSMGMIKTPIATRLAMNARKWRRASVRQGPGKKSSPAKATTCDARISRLNRCA